MLELGERHADDDQRGDPERTLHAVPIEVCGNAALAETVRRYTPLLRRPERRRFSSAAARASAERHDALIEACAAGETDAAVALSGEIWGGLDATDEPES
ncbi:FCD domain-containing protein [Streptomyces nigrescens]